MILKNFLFSTSKLVFLSGIITFTSSFASIAHAAKLADIMFVIDVSLSISDEIDEVKNRIIEFEQVLLDNDIDALYGLTTFGDRTALEELVQDFVDFSVFNAPNGEFQGLDSTSVGASQERGIFATNLAFENASFRDNSVKNFILITDEQDQTGSQDFFDRLRDDFVQDDTALFNFIGDLANSPRYNNLASISGGQGFDIEQFTINPEPFFNDFINAKLQEILNTPTPIVEPPDPSPTSVLEPSSLLALFSFGLLNLYLNKPGKNRI